MIRRDEHKEFKIDKIVLKDFIDTLMDAYAMGATFIDLTVVKSNEQDIIGITIREDYTKAPVKKLTEKMINELLQNY